jgi:hypothetical protein
MGQMWERIPCCSPVHSARNTSPFARLADQSLLRVANHCKRGERHLHAAQSSPSLSTQPGRSEHAATVTAVGDGNGGRFSPPEAVEATTMSRMTSLHATGTGDLSSQLRAGWQCSAESR